MDIMGEDDRSGSRFSDDPALHNRRTRAFPVKWIHVPENRSITELGIDPLLLPRGDGAVGRAHQNRTSADRCLYRVVGFLQFGADTIIAHFGKGRVGPAVIADFVALAHR